MHTWMLHDTTLQLQVQSTTYIYKYNLIMNFVSKVKLIVLKLLIVNVTCQ